MSESDVNVSVGVVFGTWNRIKLLRRAIASVRAAVGSLTYEIIVVDAGSTDGSKEWLRQQRDVTLIEQELPLSGAVTAFNLGFAHAVDAGHDFVMHLNDDAWIVSSGFGSEITDDLPLPCAVRLMLADPKIGEVAFALDLRGDYGYEYVNGAPYANFGLVRREAGMAVAVAQGDPSGRAWWNPLYRTYGADTEFGVWLWKLGWQIYVSSTPTHKNALRVHDANAADELRAANHLPNGKSRDSEVFWNRWRHERLESFVVNKVARASAAPSALPKPAMVTRVHRGRPGETPRRR